MKHLLFQNNQKDALEYAIIEQKKIEVETVDAIVEVKKRACDEFHKLLMQLNNGYQPKDYTHILNMIAFVQSAGELKKINTIFEHLML